jgi:hypothetical protein
LGKFLNDNGQMYDKANDLVAKADGITQDLQNGKGTLGKLLKMTRLLLTTLTSR